MKPNINFLRKVAAGEVANRFHYSPRTGGRYSFRGGELTYEKHLAGGFVNRAPAASIGRPGYVTLTDQGLAALAEADAA